VKINLSTAYHPQIDEKTERVNQILEQYLYYSVNYQQNNWMDFVSLVEFAYINTIHSSTKKTPFSSNYIHHPRANPFQVKDVGSPAEEDLAAHLVAIHDELAFQLYDAQNRYKSYSNCNWKIHPNFHIRNQTWFLRRHTQTKQPSRKLDYQ
jgi:hypothetical protein